MNRLLARFYYRWIPRLEEIHIRLRRLRTAK
jgi:hypothetical protein